MKNMRVITLACSSVVLSAALSAPSYAEHHEAATAQTTTTGQQMAGDESNKLERQASDAWREGKLDTIYLFNRHLNNFTIDPEVRGNSVVLTGKVESEVAKELAEQIAEGVDGITQVSNRLVVVSSDEARATSSDSGRTFSDRVEDSTLTAEVKTKLLANGETGGLSIHVDTVERTVTLTGDVESAAERDLAEEITKQVEGVQAVDNQLQVKS